MVDPLSLVLSVMCLIAAVGFVLFPDPLLKLSGALNRTLIVLDSKLMRHRYLVSLVLFGVSYMLFRIALLVPHIQR